MTGYCALRVVNRDYLGPATPTFPRHLNLMPVFSTLFPQQLWLKCRYRSRRRIERFLGGSVHHCPPLLPATNDCPSILNTLPYGLLLHKAMDTLLPRTQLGEL